MTGKKLSKNLQYYLQPFVAQPIVLFDRHEERTLPCVIVGYFNETSSLPDPLGHYTVEGGVHVLFQGYDDLNNQDADDVSEILVNALLCRTALLSTVNYPLSGTDTRPASGFHLNQLFLRGVEREDEDHSTTIMINFEAYCSMRDNVGS